MEFEILKRSHLKRNIIIGIVVVGIISAIVLNFTRSKYRTTQSIPLVNGTINYELSDLNLIGVYIENGNDYTKVDQIPDSGYTLNEEKSYCKIGDEVQDMTITYDMNTKTLTIAPMTTKGTKCYLYFDEQKLIHINYYSGYNDIYTCKFQYSLDNGATWNPLTFGTSAIELPLGGMIKGFQEGSQVCNIVFCSSSNCGSSTSSSSYTALGSASLNNYYTLSGKEVSYSYNLFWCFTEETKILLYDKKKRKKLKKKIKEIKVGDYIYTFDEKINDFRTTRVEKIEVIQANEIFVIQLGKETIRCSEGHSFYVKGMGYLMAKQLKIGYCILGVDNEIHKITNVYIEHHANGISLYNLYLKDSNNMFVSNLKVMSYALSLITFSSISISNVEAGYS